MVGTVFGPSPDEPRVGLFSKSLFSEIVVYLENVFEVGFATFMANLAFQIGTGWLPGE